MLTCMHSYMQTCCRSKNRIIVAAVVAAAPDIHTYVHTFPKLVYGPRQEVGSGIYMHICVHIEGGRMFS